MKQLGATIQHVSTTDGGLAYYARMLAPHLYMKYFKYEILCIYMKYFIYERFI